MINYLKEVVSDILYVSKITKTKNKKRTIFFSVLLTQLIAFADIGIILFFTTIFSDLTVLPKELSYFNFLFEIKILLPLIIAFRYYIQYLQSVVIKKLELAVQMNLKNYDYILVLIWHYDEFIIRKIKKLNKKIKIIFPFPKIKIV